MIKVKHLLLGVVGGLLLSTAGHTKVAPEVAERLKDDLTPLGGERAGNLSGTIPQWSGDQPFIEPKGYAGLGDHYPNPYADEKPLFSITADNMDLFADRLSEGTMALMASHPDTFKIQVYPSHRDGRTSDWVADQVFQNATRASLSKDGNGVKKSFGGVPFPIPRNGKEVIWNHNLKERPAYYEAVYRTAAVFSDGTRLQEVYEQTLYAPYVDPEFNPKKFKGLIAMMTLKTLEPARSAGNIVLVHEYLNQTKKPRKAWAYVAGARRVRRAPTVGYDTPNGLAGLRTTDGSDAFNGAIDRYDWTLLGKKELYIPYNQYDLDRKDLSYDELLTAGHPNMEVQRWELHRVWVLQADLKKRERHLYRQRVMYIDEDSWVTPLTDYYDNDGELWRTTAINSIYAWDMPAIVGRSEFYYDLKEKAYLADRLINEEAGLDSTVKRKGKRFFSPNGLRKMGRR